MSTPELDVVGPAGINTLDEPVDLPRVQLLGGPLHGEPRAVADLPKTDVVEIDVPRESSKKKGKHTEIVSHVYVRDGENASGDPVYRYEWPGETRAV